MRHNHWHYMYEIPLSLQSPIMNQDQTSPSDVETHVVETFRLPAETVDALSKMNVNFEQVIAEVLKEQIKKAFESVDKNPLLTDKAREMAEDLIEDLKKSPNTSSYGVVCDSSNNTEESIDKGLLNVELKLPWGEQELVVWRMPEDYEISLTTTYVEAESKELRQSWHIEVEEPMVIPSVKPKHPSVLLPIIKSLNELKKRNNNTNPAVTDMSELLESFDGVKATNQPFSFTLDPQKL